jgi:hypothetical protein
MRFAGHGAPAGDLDLADKSESEEKLEARGGIEPPIKVLQTFALPLGDRASEANQFYQKIRRNIFLPAAVTKKIEGGDVPPPSTLPGRFRLTDCLEL